MTGRAPRGPGSSGPALTAAATAIALVTSYAAGRRDVSDAEIIGDSPPELVMAALEGIIAGLLRAISPADGGERILRAAGLHFAALAAGLAELPPAGTRAGQ